MRPQYWGGYSLLGGYYASKTRYWDAERMFTQVVALAPDSYRGYSNLGGVYLLEQKQDLARKAFEKSLALRATSAAASNLGTLYFYQADYARAATAFRKALEVQSTDYIVWANLGAAEEQLKNADASRQAYRKPSNSRKRGCA